ncbi:MAG TPA: hypothetical protein VK463_03175 [Desulfomonilaceae bacterium]|nr:hypothetical protein [Desulfomonilaceae bacterium]
MTQQKVVFLITFDYEIFLGRNFGSPEAVLFEPTRRILDLCKQLNISTTFFPDVCSVWAHRNCGLDAYADAFETQLREIAQCGHDVGLHIHPHWLFSAYETGEWHLSTDRMYLSDLGFGTHPNSAGELVRRGIAYLNELLKPSNPQYECMAFRAAGLALQPKESELIRVLLESGIRIDSSIAKGLKLNMDTVSIDYSRIPKCATWYMSPETGIRCENAKGILEFPIASFQLGLPERVGFLVRRATSIGKLRGMTISRNSKQSRLSNLHSLIQENLRYLSGNPYYMLSCDTKGMNLELLLEGFDSYVGLHDDDVVYMAMINHPKLMFDEQIDLLGRFVERLTERFEGAICFQTFRQAMQSYPGQAA